MIDACMTFSQTVNNVNDSIITKNGQTLHWFQLFTIHMFTVRINCELGITLVLILNWQVSMQVFHKLPCRSI